MPHARRLAATLIAALTLLAVVAQSAQAAPVQPLTTARILDELRRQPTSAADLKQKIALQLRLAPGGTQTAPNEVSYDGGKFVVTYRMPGAVTTLAGDGDCPFHWFCFYANYWWEYPRGKLSSCGWQDLGTYHWNDRTRSVHNGTENRVDFYGHQDYGHPEWGPRPRRVPVQRGGLRTRRPGPLPRPGRPRDPRLLTPAHPVRGAFPGRVRELRSRSTAAGVRVAVPWLRADES